MRKALLLFGMIGAMGLLAETAAATAFGLRAGFGLTPDQVVVGVQGQLAGKKMKAFHLAPSVDFGFGDNLTTICGNLDLLLAFGLPGSESSLYAGLGPTLAYWDYSSGVASANDTEIGLSLVGGARFGMGSKNAYSAEVRFGVGDIPDVRILVGILFGARQPTVRR